MNPAHWVFDKFYPAIRFTYERVQGHRWFDEIAPNLWVGGAPTYDRDRQFLLDSGITAVLDMRAERTGPTDFYAAHDIAYHRVPVLDVMVPGKDQLAEAVAWVDKQMDDGRTVLVHCAKGRGRSAIVVAATLMQQDGLSFDEARELMESKRPLTKLETRHQIRCEELLLYPEPAEETTE